MTDKLYHPPASLQAKAHVKSFEQYKKMHDRSLKEPGKFWWEIAQEFYWKKAPTLANACSYNIDVNKGMVKIEWFRDGVTNVCYNLLDHNVYHKKLGDKVAFYWSVLAVVFI